MIFECRHCYLSFALSDVPVFLCPWLVSVILSSSVLWSALSSAKLLPVYCLTNRNCITAAAPPQCAGRVIPALLPRSPSNPQPAFPGPALAACHAKRVYLGRASAAASFPARSPKLDSQKYCRLGSKVKTLSTFAAHWPARDSRGAWVRQGRGAGKSGSKARQKWRRL